MTPYILIQWALTGLGLATVLILFIPAVLWAANKLVPKRLEELAERAQLTPRAAGSDPVEHVWRVKRGTIGANTMDVRDICWCNTCAANNGTLPQGAAGMLRVAGHRQGVTIVVHSAKAFAVLAEALRHPKVVTSPPARCAANTDGVQS